MEEMNEINKIEEEFLNLVKDSKNSYFITFKILCQWLNKIDLYINYEIDKQARKDFNRRYLRVKKYSLIEVKNSKDVGDFIMVKNENDISFPWFSADGFKMMCMILKSEQSFLVMRYFIRLEKKYWNALHKTKEENSKEIKKINSSNASIMDAKSHDKCYKQINKKYCYIISNDILYKENMYKFGFSTMCINSLLSCYSRGLPNASIFAVYYSANSDIIEKNVLKYFKRFRQKTHKNKLSEWINIDIKVIKDYVSYLTFDIFENYNENLFE